MKSIFFSALVLASVSAQAALPPYYQSEREIKAVLEFLPSEGHHLGEISSITKTQGGYQVVSGPCAYDVRVVYGHGGPVGPAKFSLVMREVSCLPR